MNIRTAVRCVCCCCCCCCFLTHRHMHAYTHIQHQRGHTALHLAAERSYARIALMLLKAGADPQVTYDTSGTQSNPMVCLPSPSPNLKLSPIQQPYQGFMEQYEQPLHRAASSGCVEILGKLLHHSVASSGSSTTTTTTTTTSGEPLDINYLATGGCVVVVVVVSFLHTCSQQYASGFCLDYYDQPKEKSKWFFSSSSFLSLSLFRCLSLLISSSLFFSLSLSLSLSVS